ncbi:hypothetical protein POM88_037200 [Heracleum sosnowskyi]|uniref:Peptidase C1A papain C-terminal domain-containing protein n=1 Tax=Heracleum sosnowskyi TaxID=360622 RepID=A0AAD8HQN0_9APIA|nr:hypothetical protein POM88_037200 [Heracleum sosnowskyi]
MGTDHPPLCWKVLKNWRAELPCDSPIQNQFHSSQCWNLSIAKCVKAVAYCEGNPLPDDISNNEIREWLPFIRTAFDSNYDPPAHVDVNATTWPAYHKASLSHIFQYLKCYGTHFKTSYRYESVVANNCNLFSMKRFLSMRTESPKRVFIDTFRLVNYVKAIPIVKEKHPVVGSLFANYPEFREYKAYDILSPNRPINKKTNLPYPGDHIVYIIGYGYVVRNDGEKIECFLIENTWGDKWGYKGLAMVPVTLFTGVGYPKGVKRLLGCVAFGKLDEIASAFTCRPLHMRFMQFMYAILVEALLFLGSNQFGICLLVCSIAFTVQDVALWICWSTGSSDDFYAISRGFPVWVSACILSNLKAM